MPQAKASLSRPQRDRMRREVNAAVRSYYLFLMEGVPLPALPDFLEKMKAEDNLNEITAPQKR
jgi:hypothetical protein